MAETTDKEQGKKGLKAKETVHVEKGKIEIEEVEGFTPEEISKMLKVKEDIARGHYSDITNEHKKLLFVQWLIDHDRLAG